MADIHGGLSFSEEKGRMDVGREERRMGEGLGGEEEGWGN